MCAQQTLRSACSSLSTWRRFGSLATHSEYWFDCANAQADLSLCWAHMQCWTPAGWLLFWRWVKSQLTLFSLCYEGESISNQPNISGWDPPLPFRCNCPLVWCPNYRSTRKAEKKKKKKKKKTDKTKKQLTKQQQWQQKQQQQHTNKNNNKT